MESARKETAGLRDIPGRVAGQRTSVPAGWAPPSFQTGSRAVAS